jgi:hypothetical protein
VLTEILKARSAAADPASIFEGYDPSSPMLGFMLPNAVSGEIARAYSGAA